MTNNPVPAESILIVDDEEAVRSALGKFLERLGHRVTAVGGSTEAIAAMTKEHAACILLDVHLPGGIDGTELVSRLLAIEPDAAILMLSGRNDATTAALCMQRGAKDYLTKPIELSALASAIGRALRRREQAIQERERTRLLRDEMASRNAELELARDRMEQLSVATMELLVYSLESRNDFLAGHARRVADFAASVATAMGRTEDEVEIVRLAGRLHDIGSIRTPDELLLRAGPLTHEELEHVREHVVLGWQLLSPLSHLGPVADFVRGHHERWDGSGYPDGLIGDAIPWGAQVLAAAEVYDALTTARPYKEKLSLEEAAARIREMSGKTVSPDVSDALASVIAARRALTFVDEMPTHIR